MQGLVVRYPGGERLFGYAVPEERRPEVDTCYIKEMLARAPAELQPVEFDGGDAARGVRREQKTKGR
ncbi:MAG: hypothetical protein WBB22_13260 [Anaerolineae bacterium]